MQGSFEREFNHVGYLLCKWSLTISLYWYTHSTLLHRLVRVLCIVLVQRAWDKITVFFFRLLLQAVSCHFTGSNDHCWRLVTANIPTYKPYTTDWVNNDKKPIKSIWFLTLQISFHGLPLFQVAIKIIDKTQLNPSSLQKVSMAKVQLNVYKLL